MKVFQINTVCGSGSTGRIAVNLAHMLEAQGHESCIAYARGNAPEDVDSFRFGSKLEIYWHGIMTRLTDRHGMYSKGATKQLIAKIKEYNPDIIHLHNVHGYYVNIEMLFSFLKEYKRPVVWTLHDCWTYTGHCSHYTCVKCDKWKTQCYECPLKRDYPGSLLLDNSRNNYQKKKALFTGLEQLHLVTPSVWLKEQVEQSFFFQNHKERSREIVCTAIPNGIETDKFVRTASDLKERYRIENKKVILGVANVWTKQKGIEDFIQLSKLLDDNYQLVMIGMDEKRKRMLPKNILALERTKNIGELIQWYSVADVYFNSSIEETMGMTTGEAISCGIPVVTYDSTAVPESVGEGCGHVIPAGNVKMVKEAIERIEVDRDSYVKNCLAYKKQFAEKKANEAYSRIYQDVLEER